MKMSNLNLRITKKSKLNIYDEQMYQQLSEVLIANDESDPLNMDTGKVLASFLFLPKRTMLISEIKGYVLCIVPMKGHLTFVLRSSRSVGILRLYPMHCR